MFEAAPRSNVEIDAQDRLMRYGEETFGYNLNAEMRSRTNGDDVTTYAWSPFGNLEQVMLPDGTEMSYELDPTGRRVGRSVDGERTHGWLYRDHLNPVAQLDADGRLEQVYLYGTQPHVPDAIPEIGAGGAVVSTYRVVTDVRGSVRLVVNADTGAVVQELRYSPFGEVLHDSNPGFQPFGFAGGLWDADTGLVRFGAREYDARLGRWLSRDPILFNGGDPNLFGYVLGDPVNWVDPEGLEVSVCWGPDEATGGRLRHFWLRFCRSDGQRCEEFGFAPGGWQDEADRSFMESSECREVPSADADCIAGYVESGRQGNYHPFNHCQDAVIDALRACDPRLHWHPRLRVNWSSYFRRLGIPTSIFFRLQF